MALGFSNVMVGVSIGDLIRGIAVFTAQSAVMESVAAGMHKLTEPEQGKVDCGCP
jgi:hypothetical protein